MRWIVAVAALVILAIGSLVPNRVEATAVMMPAGIQAAIRDTNLLHTVACRRMWSCGLFGCNWRPICWGYPYEYGYGGPLYYAYEGPYGWGQLYRAPPIGGSYYGGAPYDLRRPYRPY